MEHVNIITKEAITRGLSWPPIVIGCIGILFCLWVFAYLIFHKHIKGDYMERVIKLLVHAFAILPIMLISMGICTVFFHVETGRYEYTATLDHEMTITEFEEFQSTYDDIKFEDGVWYFKDKEN